MSTVDLTQVSKEELAQALAEKEQAEKKANDLKVKRFEQKKENFVVEVVSQFTELQDIMMSLKRDAVTEGNALWEEMFKLQNSEPKDQKQFSLTNKAKTLKVVVDRAERMGFNEEAFVGIQGVKDYFKQKFASRSKQVYDLLDTLLVKNGAGDYDPKLLSKLRSQVNEINDPVLTKNFNIIEENQVVVGTALYLRAYNKDKMDKWQDISLQFSSL